MLNDCSRRPSILSKDAASRRISLGPRVIFMRSDISSPSDMLLAALTIFSIGLNAPRAISQPPATDSTISAGSSVHVRMIIVCITPDRSAAGITPRIHTIATSMSTIVS